MPASYLCSAMGFAPSSARSREISAPSESACELTETYSPADIDIAPATRPARPATMTLLCVACALTTPIMRLAVESTPSFAPSTPARSHPSRPTLCLSGGPGVATVAIPTLLHLASGRHSRGERKARYHNNLY